MKVKILFDTKIKYIHECPIAFQKHHRLTASQERNPTYGDTDLHIISLYLFQKQSKHACNHHSEMSQSAVSSLRNHIKQASLLGSHQICQCYESHDEMFHICDDI